MLLTQNHFGVGMQPVSGQGIHAHAVVRSGAAYALHHVDPVPAPSAGRTVVLRTSKVASLFGDLSQRRSFSTAAQAGIWQIAGMSTHDIRHGLLKLDGAMMGFVLTH